MTGLPYECEWIPMPQCLILHLKLENRWWFSLNESEGTISFGTLKA
jgi:hypothetical protein